MRKSSKKRLAAQLFELMTGIFLVQQILGHADLLSHRLMVVDGGRIFSQQSANPTCPRRFPSDVAISFCGGGRVDDREWQVELTFERAFSGFFTHKKNRASRTMNFKRKLFLFSSAMQFRIGGKTSVKYSNFLEFDGWFLLVWAISFPMF